MSNKLEQLEARVVELEAVVKVISEKLESVKPRDRGPSSTREMTDADARRILAGGDLEKTSHKEAAEKLGLSYAQVYSCRGSYTFKHIHKAIAEKAKALVAAQ